MRIAPPPPSRPSSRNFKDTGYSGRNFGSTPTGSSARSFGSSRNFGESSSSIASSSQNLPPPPKRRGFEESDDDDDDDHNSHEEHQDDNNSNSNNTNEENEPVLRASMVKQAVKQKQRQSQSHLYDDSSTPYQLRNQKAQWDTSKSIRSGLIKEKMKSYSNLTSRGRKEGSPDLVNTGKKNRFMVDDTSKHNSTRSVESQVNESYAARRAKAQKRKSAAIKLQSVARMMKAMKIRKRLEEMRDAKSRKEQSLKESEEKRQREEAERLKREEEDRLKREREALEAEERNRLDAERRAIEDAEKGRQVIKIQALVRSALTRIRVRQMVEALIEDLMAKQRAEEDAALAAQNAELAAKEEAERQARLAEEQEMRNRRRAAYFKKYGLFCGPIEPEVGLLTDWWMENVPHNTYDLDDWDDAMNKLWEQSLEQRFFQYGLLTQAANESLLGGGGGAFGGGGALGGGQHDDDEELEENHEEDPNDMLLGRGQYAASNGVSNERMQYYQDRAAAEGEHLANMNQPIHTVSDDDASLGSIEDIFDTTPSQEDKPVGLLAAAKRAKANMDNEQQQQPKMAPVKEDESNPRHLSTLNQPKRRYSDDEISLHSMNELFDGQPQEEKPVGLLAAAKKAKANMDKEEQEKKPKEIVSTVTKRTLKTPVGIIIGRNIKINCLVITDIKPTSLFVNSKLGVGQKLIQINDVQCWPDMSPKDAVDLIKGIEGELTLTTVNLMDVNFDQKQVSDRARSSMISVGAPGGSSWGNLDEHLSNLNQPKTQYDDDDASLDSMEIFDHPNPRQQQPVGLLAAAKRAKANMDNGRQQPAAADAPPPAATKSAPKKPMPKIFMQQQRQAPPQPQDEEIEEEIIVEEFVDDVGNGVDILEEIVEEESVEEEYYDPNDDSVNISISEESTEVIYED